MDPRDDAFNLLRQPDLIQDGEFNFLLKGPVPRDTSTILMNLLTQATDDPFEYYLGFDFATSGTFE